MFVAAPHISISQQRAEIACEELVQEVPMSHGEWQTDPQAKPNREGCEDGGLQTRSAVPDQTPHPSAPDGWLQAPNLINFWPVCPLQSSTSGKGKNISLPANALMNNASNEHLFSHFCAISHQLNLTTRETRSGFQICS